MIFLCWATKSLSVRAPTSPNSSVERVCTVSTVAGRIGGGEGPQGEQLFRCGIGPGRPFFFLSNAKNPRFPKLAGYMICGLHV